MRVLRFLLGKFRLWSTLISLQISDFDFYLPPELIAQQPLEDRAGSRMLVLHRDRGIWEDRHFRDLPEYVLPGDCLVLNDSRVVRSRLLGIHDGSEVEVFLTRPLIDDHSQWSALVRPGKRLFPGEVIIIGQGALRAVVLHKGDFGERTVRLEADGPIDDAIERFGHVPLPPYIKRSDTEADRERYQTVFAREKGSVAAPTAGLHFTREMIEASRTAGATIAFVTLHIGLGTFQPLRAGELNQVKLHSETFCVPRETKDTMDAAHRVMAVGTTSVRAIESNALGLNSETDLFISPGFRFKRTGAMLTNFHLPKSSLLILVSAFAGRELTLRAYQYAVQQCYRFFSYGDCMLIL